MGKPVTDVQLGDNVPTWNPITDPEREKQMASRDRHRGRTGVGTEGLVSHSRPAGEWEVAT